MKGNRPKGSVELLAKAMRQVFGEAVQECVEPVRKDMKKMEGRRKQDIAYGLELPDKDIRKRPTTTK